MLATEHTLDPEALFTISAGGFSATADAFARDEGAETLWFLSMVGSQTALKAIWACLLKQPPDTAHHRREAWVAQKVKEGIDVLICHPRLVQTGLDLVDFPTICWMETAYSVYTMRQASRRSWRIGQTRPVRVVFMAYRNSLQADALKLVAKKLQSSLAVEGELPEDGLAAFGDDGDDLMLALARKIVNGDEGDLSADEAGEETVEAAFAHARDAEAVGEELLVDEGWHTVEPEPVEVHRNGTAPSVEVVMANGNLPAEEPNEAEADGGTLKKCVNSQAVYPLCEQHGLEAQERRYTAHEEGKH